MTEVLQGAIGSMVSVLFALVLWRLHAIEVKIDKHIQFHLEQKE